MKKKKQTIPFIIAVASILSFTGCEYIGKSAGDIYLESVLGNEVDRKHDMKIVNEYNNIVGTHATSPDTDTWLQQRQQMAKAIGDRDYDANFSRTFDSLVLAVSSLEIPVKNMERQSGYLSAEGLKLPLAESEAMKNEALRQWADIRGFDSSCLDAPIRSAEIRSYKVTPQSYALLGGMGSTPQKTVTLQLIKLGEDRTRVKARVSNVYYPPELKKYYERIWQAVDKQIFIDRNIDGETVEARQ